MKMQQQVFLKAHNPSMADIKASTTTKRTASLASFMAGEHDGTSKPERKSREETVSMRQPSDLHKLGEPSLLMDEVGEIDIDGAEDEDYVVFHPIDTASIFRARPVLPGKSCATPLLDGDGETSSLSRSICKAVSISHGIDSNGDEEQIAPLPMQQGLPTSNSSTGINHHTSYCCEASEVTYMSQSVRLLGLWQ
jgi:hypothetical protein